MDTNKLKELAKLVSFCRKNGITHIKTGDIELDFAIQSLFPESEYKRKKDLADQSEPKSEAQYTDEEILMWSSIAPGMDGAN